MVICLLKKNIITNIFGCIKFNQLRNLDKMVKLQVFRFVQPEILLSSSQSFLLTLNCKHCNRQMLLIVAYLSPTLWRRGSWHFCHLAE